MPQTATLQLLEWSEGMQRNNREISGPEARRTLGFRRTTMRVMHRKSQGIVAVYEQDPTAVEDGPRALVFESSAVCTQLASYPKDWHRLSDEELIALQRLPS